MDTGPGPLRGPLSRTRGPSLQGWRALRDPIPPPPTARAPQSLTLTSTLLNAGIVSPPHAGTSTKSVRKMSR